MSFRLYSFKFLHGRFAGVIFFAGWTLHAADPGGAIQIVPVKGNVPGSDVNQLRPTEPQSFKSEIPDIRSPFSPGSSLEGMMATPVPPPSRSVAPNQREKEMLDRRRNWAFATPDDLGLTPESIFHLKQSTDDEDKPPTTALERYLDRLNNSSHSTTNRFAKSDFSNSWNDRTNSLAGKNGDDNDRPSFDSPFNSAPSTSVFKSPELPTTFSDVFGLNKHSSEEETLRAQQVYQSHIESFKQVWDFQQPAASTATTPSFSSFSSGSESSPAGTFQPAASTINSSAGGSAAPSSLAPVQPAPTPVRTAPPKPDYSIPQRRF
jgi:hypothetical protein